jgi:hypothetical protein
VALDVQIRRRALAAVSCPGVVSRLSPLPRLGDACFRASCQFRHFRSLPVEGVPASLGPGAENREWGEKEARWNLPIVYVAVPLPENLHPENHPQSQKSQLALAIAQGTSVTAWAAKNGVPRRTAFEWARGRKLRAEVERIRRGALDRAVGRMARRVTWATEGIAKLAKGAASESVKLAALRTILADMIAASKFGGLEDRMTELEERYGDRS